MKSLCLFECKVYCWALSVLVRYWVIKRWFGKGWKTVQHIPLYCLDPFTSGKVLFIILTRAAYSLLFPSLFTLPPFHWIPHFLPTLLRFFLMLFFLHCALPPFLSLPFLLSLMEFMFQLFKKKCFLFWV